MQIYEINFASNPATQGYSKVSQNVPTLIRPAQPQSARTQAQTQAEPEKGMFGHLKDILKKKKRDQETGYFSKEFGVDPKLFMTKKELEDLRAEEEGKKLQQTTVAKTPVAPTPTPTSTQSQATVSATSNSNTAAPAAPAAPAATTPTVNYNIPAYQRKGQPAPVTTPVPAKAAPVNYNIPAYQRKGISIPGSSTPASPAGSPAVATSAAPTAAPATTAQKSATKLTTGQINQALSTIRTRDLQSIKKNIDALLAARQKPKAAGAGVMSSMASQLTNKPTTSSTGGTTTPTATGLVNRAKPITTTATTTAKPTATPAKVSAAKAGAPTAAEQQAFEKKLQQAMARQSSTQQQGA